MKMGVGMVHILAFEDNPADLLLLKESLRIAGLDYQLEVASRGEEALALLRCLGTGETPCPDVIVMDLQLCGVDGCELVRTLRERGSCPATPIMVLTGCLSCREEEKARALGVKRFVRKPMNLRDFLKIGDEIRDLLAVPK
jgi:two-component system, chemotaxis family, response regulator Rcp1